MEDTRNPVGFEMAIKTIKYKPDGVVDCRKMGLLGGIWEQDMNYIEVTPESLCYTVSSA